MDKAKSVLDFYVLCNKLKDIVRTGWKDWRVSRERVESIAEHIYGVQMLAIAMHSEYQYDIDLTKVILMLAIHELGETVIGDCEFIIMSETSTEASSSISFETSSFETSEEIFSDTAAPFSGSQELKTITAVSKKTSKKAMLRFIMISSLYSFYHLIIY